MNIHSKLYVYDLKCLKETNAVPTHLLLTTIDLECKIKAMMMPWHNRDGGRQMHR